MTAIARWLGERIPIDPAALRELTNEPVPHHMKRWWFCLGGTPAYLFLVQIFTGILLAIYYQPRPPRPTNRSSTSRGTSRSAGTFAACTNGRRR